MFNKVMGGAAMKNTLEAKKKTRFYVDRKGGLVKAAWIFMLMSAVFRILGCWGLWNDSAFSPFFQCCLHDRSPEELPTPSSPL